MAELSISWVTAAELAPLPGYACVVAKRHVREPFELPARERAAFWEDAMQAAQGLAELFQPVKVNYEIHGNTIPHLHMHLYPRLPADFGRAVPTEPSYKRSLAELGRLASAVTGSRLRG